MKIHYWRVYHEGGDPLIPARVTSNQSFDSSRSEGVRPKRSEVNKFVGWRRRPERS